MLRFDPAPYILHVAWEVTERIQRDAPSLRPAHDEPLPPRHPDAPYVLIKHQRLHSCRMAVCRPHIRSPRDWNDVAEAAIELFILPGAHVLPKQPEPLKEFAGIRYPKKLSITSRHARSRRTPGEQQHIGRPRTAAVRVGIRDGAGDGGRPAP